MIRYLLDTNHAGRLLRDASDPLWARLGALDRSSCLLCRPVVAELWFMIHNSARPQANLPKLQSLLDQFQIVEFDERSAMEYGVIRADLRRKGKPVPSFDVLIASIARTNDLTLLTDDSHFAHVEDLKTENWLAGR